MNLHYRRAMEQVSLSPAARERMETEIRQARPRRRAAPRRWAAVAAAAALACALTITANAEGIRAFFRQLNPSFASSLVPVGQSCTDQGLTLTVESATVKDGRIHVYFLVQNDGDSDVMKNNIYSFHFSKLMDTNNPNCSFSGHSYEFLGYDPQNDAWRVLLTVEEHNPQNDAWRVPPAKEEKDTDKYSASDGSRHFTLSVDEMLVDQGFTSVDLTPDWQTLPAESETTVVQANVWNYVQDESWSFVDGISRPSHTAVLQESHAARVLVPDSSANPAADGYTVSAIGFLEDGLHVQMRHETDTSGDREFLYLSHPDAEEAGLASFVSFMGADSADYGEYIFDISPEEIDGCSLQGSFWTGGKTVKGDWTVTFDLEEQEKTAHQE